ncbi:hypothetical protein GH714_037127 [Hevea brasiliensis]|uniref:Mediator of RNA polymerase II transcription subunit 33A n=1 Tax=Hevea brasiliensis TaxID=3981 RepID=A0A6A6MMA6_HEVBR|nr:hypothetical protein GH714_037127 [Hevea brasiliensis]
MAAFLQPMQQTLWDSVLQFTKSAQDKNSDPLLWAIQLSSSLNSAGVVLPSTELAHLLVSYICFENSVPIMWKFLEKALTVKIAAPMLVLALLSTRHVGPLAHTVFNLKPRTHTHTTSNFCFFWNFTRVVPNRQLHPAAYRLYMELVKRHAFSFASHVSGPNYPKIMKSVDEVLHLSHIFGLQVFEPGLLLVEYVFSMVWQLLDASLDDEGLLNLTSEKKSKWPTSLQDLEIDGHETFGEKRNELHEGLHKANTTMAIELMGEFLQNKVTSRILYLAQQNFWSVLWLPIDLFLEDAMDGSQVAAIGAVENLTGLVKALQAVNGTTWHDTFLGLWIAALRLVQREREPSEGPVPRIDTCLCMLLSITTLAVANIIEEEEGELIDEIEHSPTDQMKEKQGLGKCRRGLITALQLLGDYDSLLTPPQSVTSVANQAAAKATLFISGVNSSNSYYESMSMNDMPINCSHGFDGSLPEIEKVYEIAVSGSNDEKITAANILCGASLLRGWNIQEHTVLFIIKLLSPPVPADYSGSESYLIDYAPLLNVLLVGISSVDCVQILSLHGLAPLLAGALMPICEVFGSSVPKVSSTLPSEDEISCHAVFSNAFSLLVRLWRFHYPPLENVMGDKTPVGSQVGPEYLLLVRNSQLASFGTLPRDRIKIRRYSKNLNISLDPIFMDSFPQLKRWYWQHIECIVSTFSGLVHGTPVHQLVDALLNMMFRRINRSVQSLTSTTSGSSNSSGPGAEEAYVGLQVPAWDILEATPFALDAALTACAHGRLSPRELATGLKDLADFLPASLATIVSYLSAEVTRGIWKPAFMNGTDWPSPAANLATVEQQIKKILSATGVDIPSLPVGGNSPATLPLPLAALVSLTITYRLDKVSDRFLVLVGPALNALAAGCPWPCMPIISALWAQKVKRWSDFLVFSASGTVFHHNGDAVVQLLKSCFTSTLGFSPPHISSNGGVGALLGHGFGSHLSGGISAVAPGILYLRVHRSIRDVMFMTEKILSILMHSVEDIANSGLPRETVEKLKRAKYGMRYGQVSLAAAMMRVKLAASLGASLVWISGGLSLVQSLIQETLPSWFISAHGSEQEGGESGGVVNMLGGYALAFLVMLCGTFAWGVDSQSPPSKRRPKVLGSHLEFLASALDGKISLGCDWATARAYVSGFLSLMVTCTPTWVREVNVDLLKRLSKGLRQWNEEELAVALLGLGGIGAMGAAAELIIETGL